MSDIFQDENEHFSIFPLLHHFSITSVKEQKEGTCQKTFRKTDYRCGQREENTKTDMHTL